MIQSLMLSALVLAASSLALNMRLLIMHDSTIRIIATRNCEQMGLSDQAI